MTQNPSETRRFSVHARHLDPHHARLLEEASFEAAAVAYIEDFQSLAADAHDISVIVRDIGTGHEHSFRIDLDSGEAVPTG